MEKQEKLVEKLDLVNEIYRVQENMVVIRTESALDIYVTFKKDSYLIEGRLMRWNFLTGFLKMTLKSSYRYVKVMITLLILIFMLFNILGEEIIIGFNTAVFGISILILISCLTILTFVQLEFLYRFQKHKIMNWLD
jgi:hypothetical protein